MWSSMDHRRKTRLPKLALKSLPFCPPTPSGFMRQSYQIPKALQMHFALLSPHHFLLCHLLYLPISYPSIQAIHPGINALGKLALTTSPPKSKRVSKLFVTLRLPNTALSTYLPGSPGQPLLSFRAVWRSSCCSTEMALLHGYRSAKVWETIK